MNLLKELTAIRAQLTEAVGFKTKLDKVDKELREAAETVELTDFSGKELPDSAWPNGVTYKGQSVFDLVYGERPAVLDRAENSLKRDTDNYRRIDFQEIYLGYDPTHDVFVQGYDGWITEYDEDADEEDDTNASPYITFQVRDGKVKVITKGLFMGAPGSMWYNDPRSGYKEAHRKFPNLIDIRLD